MNTKNSRIENTLHTKILPFVTKPGRYIGNEINAVHKNKTEVAIRFALAFPEVYEIAMSYMGYDILYHILNQRQDIWAERVYAPWQDMEVLLRREQLPLFSLESFTPLKSFDLIGFTLQYELTYTNILNMLDLAGIPLFSKDRAKDDPVILAGGPTGCNPEPMAPFFDAVLIGDGEEAVLEICDIIKETRQQDNTRTQTLEKLAGINGIYIPAFYTDSYDGISYRETKASNIKVPKRVKTRIIPQLEPKNYPSKPLVPLIEVTHDRFPVEVMRGCTEGCRYCNAGMIYRPIRERHHKEIIDQISKGIEQSGYTEISLLSLSISDYSQLPDLIREEKKILNKKNVSVSLPSMRLDSFNEEIAEFVASVRKSGFTFAPEAGSERLRRVINKNISDIDLFRSVEIAFKNGWKLLKFYFMIGLPTETEEDVKAIADLVDQVVRLGKKYGKIRYHVSISPFSPKPHTPFQWERQNSKEELLTKIDLLQNRFARIRQARLSWRDPEVSIIECVLGRGDRRMANVIYHAWKNGAVFDGWTDHFKFSDWQFAFNKAGLSMQDYLEKMNMDNPLPWDHIDKGLTKAFLKNERHNAYEEITVADCKAGSCLGCGIQRKGGFAEFAQCYQPKNRIADPNELQLSETNDADTDLIKPIKPRPESVFYRVRFAKTNYARYLSHLDIVRAMERACRRAEIPMLYSQGYNPHPRMSFAPPLSLGYTSTAEYVDLEIAAYYQDNLITTLNPYLPAGLKLIDLRIFKDKPKALAETISASRYTVDMKNSQIDNENFNSALDRILSAEKINVFRRVKGKEKEVDIRPYIASIIKKERSLEINTKYVDKRTVRLNELLNALFGDNHSKKFAMPVHREAQLIYINGRVLSPLEVHS